MFDRAEQSSAAEASSLAALLNTRHPLSSSDLQNGVLYMTGGGAQPLVLHSMTKNSTGSVIVSAFSVAGSAQITATQVKQGKVYFISRSGNIGIHDLQTGSGTELILNIDLPGSCLFSDEVAVQDFLMTENTIFFIHKECVKEMPTYRLRSFDLASHRSRLIADVSSIGIDGAGVAFVRDGGSDAAVRVKSAYIDAGYGNGKIYDIATKDGALTEVAHVSFQNCDVPDACNQHVLDENRKFEKYFPWSREIHCGPWTMTEATDLTIRRGKDVTTVSNGIVLACFIDGKQQVLP